MNIANKFIQILIIYIGKIIKIMPIFTKDINIDNYIEREKYYNESDHLFGSKLWIEVIFFWTHQLSFYLLISEELFQFLWSFFPKIHIFRNNIRQISKNFPQNFPNVPFISWAISIIYHILSINHYLISSINLHFHFRKIFQLFWTSINS